MGNDFQDRLRSLRREGAARPAPTARSGPPEWLRRKLGARETARPTSPEDQAAVPRTSGDPEDLSQHGGVWFRETVRGRADSHGAFALDEV